MSKRKQVPDSSPKEKSTPAPETGAASVDKNEGGTKWHAVADKWWRFFWNDLTMAQKLISVTFLLVVVGGIIERTLSVAWRYHEAALNLAVNQEGDKFRQQLDERQEKIIKLTTDLAKAERQDDEPTIETAIPDPISFADFLGKLDEARRGGEIVEAAFVDEYRGKKVQWDCVILETIIRSRAYFIGPSAPTANEDRAFVRFGPEAAYDCTAKSGEKKRIEGVLYEAGRDNIILYDCRFVSEKSNPAPPRKK